MNSGNHLPGTPDNPPQLAIAQATWLHLLPGIPALLAYTVLAAVMVPRGWPNILALMLVSLSVEVPISWLIMIHQVRKETGGRFTFVKAFPWHAKIPVWIYPVIGLPLIFFSVFMMAGVGPVIDQALLAGPFSSVPDWFAMRGDPGMFASLSGPMMLAIWALMLVSFVLLGGISQELYFRGFLLPRIAHLGKTAPLMNAALFAVFHLVAPWSWVTFFLMTMPWAYLVWWRRSVWIGIFIHVGMLFLQWLMMSLLVFGIVQLPAGSQ